MPSPVADVGVRLDPPPQPIAAGGAYRHWFAAAVVIGLVGLYLAPLPWFGLSEPDEARYAEVSREMLRSGDWVTPHQNGVKFFYKPPLVYWLTAAALWTLGEHEFAVRLVSACAGLLTVWLTYLLARDMFGGHVAVWAAMMLATAPFFYVMSQVLTMDIPLTASVTAALTCFWFAYTRPRDERWWYRGMYAAVGTGLLIKGPVAVVVPGLTVAAFLTSRREWGRLTHVLRADGVLVAGLIALPWYVLVTLRNPEFPWFFFVHEHWLARYAAPDHPLPWWFFIPVLAVGMLPWTLLAAGSVNSSRPRAWSRLAAGDQFSLVWVGATLLFFSLTRGKIATYVLPLFPALAILLARGVCDQVARGSPRGLRLIAAALLVIASAALVASAVAPRWVAGAELTILRSRLTAAGAEILLSAGVALAYIRRRWLSAALGALCAGIALSLAIGISARGLRTQYRPLARSVAASAGPDDLIVVYRHYVYGVSFYTHRRVIAVRGWADLELGRQYSDDAATFFWPDDQQLIATWPGQQRMILVANRADLEALRPQLVPPPIEIASQGKKVAVSNLPRSVAAAAPLPD